MPITELQAEVALDEILKGSYSVVATHWQETFPAYESANETIGRGLDALIEALPENSIGALHGWIDQAVLEIMSIEPIADLRKKLFDYRADQNGDTGIITIPEENPISLEISFDRRRVEILEYNKPNKAP